MAKIENLFPVIYNEQEFFKEDCNEMFLAFYTCKAALNNLGGVYMAEGMWIYPDGTMNTY